MILTKPDENYKYNLLNRHPYDITDVTRKQELILAKSVLKEGEYIVIVSLVAWPQGGAGTMFVTSLGRVIHSRVGRHGGVSIYTDYKELFYQDIRSDQSQDIEMSLVRSKDLTNGGDAIQNPYFRMKHIGRMCYVSQSFVDLYNVVEYFNKPKGRRSEELSLQNQLIRISFLLNWYQLNFPETVIREGGRIDPDPDNFFQTQGVLEANPIIPEQPPIVTMGKSAEDRILEIDSELERLQSSKNTPEIQKIIKQLISERVSLVGPVPSPEPAPMSEGGYSYGKKKRRKRRSRKKRSLRK